MTSSEAPSDSAATQQNSKVARVIDKYDLSGLGEEIEASWTNDDEERRSLRELANYFNKQVLQAAMERAGMSPLEGEAGNTYRLLAGNDVSGGARRSAEKSLEREDIDPEELRRDFVSHQAIYTYLTKYRGVSRPSESEPDETQMEKDARTIRRLKNRVVAVTEKTVENLRDTERLTLGDFDVLVNVRVYCNDCGTQRAVSDLFAAGGCECQPDDG